MLQEKQELNEPPKQSTSFLVLQEILESEEKGNQPCVWSEAVVWGLGWGVVVAETQVNTALGVERAQCALEGRPLKC